MTYKLGSLFDGSGGFPLAGSLCGITPTWASEVEPYPIAVTRSRFPAMKHLGDISKINGAEVEPVDIITFGSPCQDLSVAGLRKGLRHEANGDDETTRSGLFMEAVRIIKEMRGATNGRYPTFALWENVPGAFSSNKGEDFRIVCEELIKIVEPSASMPAVPKNGWPYADSYCGDGWSLAYRVFDAQYWGVPQRRRRIHLVVDFRGERAQEVLFEREGVRGYFETGRAPWQGLASYAEGSAGADDRRGLDAVIAIDKESYTCGSGFDRAPGIAVGGPCATLQTSGTPHAVCYVEHYLFENHSQDTRYKGPLDISPMLPAQLGTGGNNTPFVVEESNCYCLQGNCVDRADTASCNGKGWKEDTCYTLNTIDRPAVVYGVETFHCNTEEEKVPTLKARDWKDPNVVAYKKDDVRYIVRRLTPTECARLQGFPDKWGHPEQKEAFTDEEYRFWLEVRNTHATVIGGKEAKEYTETQMLTWYNKLHTDSSEYKMWGNGIALPTALYCLQGIRAALDEGRFDEVTAPQADVCEEEVCEVEEAEPVVEEIPVVTEKPHSCANSDLISAYAKVYRHRKRLTRQQMRTLKGQIQSGDVGGAMRGLEKLLKREGL